MKHLLRILFFLPFLSLSALAAENVGQCFHVRQMVKTEEIRYGVDAISECRREYEAVYVLVAFLDRAGKRLDEGVWAIYWCRPGRREIHEFAIPAGALGFERVVLTRITADAREALMMGRRSIPSGVPAGHVADPGEPNPPR
ncbi:MAG TPA: hypothetical protein VKV74_05425 [Bryobacteraceae bacterium]|nr:hypothetical protein [Bryobacteraceae bacterium]